MSERYVVDGQNMAGDWLIVDDHNPTVGPLGRMYLAVAVAVELEMAERIAKMLNTDEDQR